MIKYIAKYLIHCVKKPSRKFMKNLAIPIVLLILNILNSSFLVQYVIW